MASRYPVSKLARAVGIISIVVAVLAVGVPLMVATALYRGVSVDVLTTPVVGLVGTAIALIGLIIAIMGAIIGRTAQSATVIIGGMLNVGVLLGFVLAVFVPMLLG